MININNYLQSGFHFSQSENELRFKYQFFNILLAFTVFIVTLAALIRFYNGEYVQALIDGVYSVVNLTVILLVRRKKHYFNIFIYFVIFFSLFIVSFTFINLQNSYVGISWFFVEIIIVLFLTNTRFTFFILGLSIAIILTTQYLHFQESEFKYAIFGIFPLIVFSIFMSAYERRNKLQAEQLQEQHRLLKKYTFEIENFDLITNLPNRISFTKALNQKVFSKDETHFSIIKIDIDDFKNINEAHGFGFADKIVHELSLRIKPILKDAEMLSKSGPDEFLALINIVDTERLTDLANNLLNTTKEVFCINEQRIFITLSLGIARYPEDAQSSSTLIKHVDTALHIAKKAGKNSARFYNQTLTDSLNKKMQLLLELQDAVENSEFETYFQPQIDAKENKITGMETLVRWIHPEKGLISPVAFIPLAEENGLIKDIDFFVMKSAMSTFIEFKKIKTDIGRLSINLSMKLLEDKEYMGYLHATMDKSGFNPNWLEIEITESQIMNNPQKSIDILQEIRQLGIHVAIDDFGTGYSSLSYLQKLPINKLKIDRSFIIDVPEDQNAVTLVKLIINLAKSLNLNIIAEGIEDEAQKEFIVKEGCSNIQGYYFSKPLPKSDMATFIEQYK